MALNTINTYLARYSALFEWARLNTSVTENFFTGLAIKRRKRAADDREPFSAEDLSAIFTQPVYTELKYKHPYQYWLPLLALLTGARINELAQLHVADVEQDDNSCFLSINRDTSDKTLKNAASERRIPLHSRLAELGFLDYVAHLQHRGQDRVFPELPQGRDGYSKNASRWFNNSFKRDCGISHPKKVFHSFRHTFATALKHNQIPEGHAKALLGHTNSSITYDHYGKEYPLHQLAGAIEQLDYSNALHAVEPFSVSSG
ncbi:MAG TPA: site-specific integrase [Alphaproteobacteria bacterium]|nr:site-specific integrase [Alphaproteobacteria bacterium]